MNRQFLAGVVSFTVATVCISVPECSGWAPPLDIDSDWKVYAPVGVWAIVDAWVESGGPVYWWDWDWASGAYNVGQADYDYSSSSWGIYDSSGIYSVYVYGYSTGGSDDAHSYVYAVAVTQVISSTSAACVGQNVTFGAITDPLNCAHLVTVTWSAPGGTPSSGTGSQFTTKWSTPGPKTVTATCGDSNASKSITVFTIKSETVSTVPPGRNRTILGIGEPVTCWTEPSVSVNWSVEGPSSVYPETGTSTTFTAVKSPSYATVHAQKGSADCTLDFEVIAPSGMNVVKYQDLTPGVSGPPNNKIGASSQFTSIVLPTSVCFQWAEFRENIPTDTWIWPDGTEQSNLAHTVPWSVGYNNLTIDTLSPQGGLQPIGRIHDGSSYVSFSYTIRVPAEYKNQYNQWTSWLPGETHPREFRGSDQKARVIFNATNSANGDWMGPWQ